MLDVLFILISLLFFVIATAYVHGCDLLRPRTARPRGTEEAKAR